MDQEEGSSNDGGAGPQDEVANNVVVNMDQGEEGDNDDDGGLGPLREKELEARMECLKTKAANPEMFVSGFDVDETGIEDPEDPDCPGEKLLKAAEDGDLEIIKTLVSSEASVVENRDKDGYTALHRAAYSNHPKIIRYLVEVGADVEVGTEDGWTPVHCACHWNSYKVVRELINCNANVNAQTNGGQTPLHIASNQQSRECMIILLTCPGIDVSLKNRLGETAQDVAGRSGRFAHLFDLTKESINKL